MIVLQANKKRLRRLVFSPDGPLLAATGKDGEVSFKPTRVDGIGHRLWDITKGKWLLMSATPKSLSDASSASMIGFKTSRPISDTPTIRPVPVS